MAEQPVMDSATDNPSPETVVPTPKPYKNEGEAVNDLKNLLNASRTQEVPSETSEKTEADSEMNNEDLLEDDELIDQVENEEPLESSEELYKIKVGDQELEVTLDELKNGYSRQQDYTRKTKKLSEDRTQVDDLQKSLTRQNEEAKIRRDQYEKQLEVLSQHLKSTENNVDLDRLYQEDPAEYVRQKAEIDRRKEMMEATRQEQQRVLAEKQKEHEKTYNAYLEKERKLLAEKLPIYADKDKGPTFVKNLTDYAKSIGYTDQEISMLVDHRAVLMLANAYRYNKLRNSKVKDKKVVKTPRVVSSSSPKVQDDNDNVKRIRSKKANLKKTGSVKDAVSVLQELYSQ
jgi:hypothetical protein|tara:strand:- start:5775 stop:6809 length:1035 start_codon:yes stop_codon:yes gene_type:complete